MAVQMSSTKPGRVNSSTHTSDGHPDAELPSCQRHVGALALCSLRGLEDQGLPASGLTSALRGRWPAVPGSSVATLWSGDSTTEMDGLNYLQEESLF